MKKSMQKASTSCFEKDDKSTQTERRSHDRQIAMLRLAKIRSGSREGWGFIKNLSAQGMMLEVHPDFDLGDTVSAILTEEQELIGAVRWREGALVGIEFDEAIDIAGLLHKSPETRNGRISRIPRIQISHPVNLIVGSRFIEGDMCDISPTGICIKTSHAFELGKRIGIRITDLLDIKGKVRWQSHDRIGIAFEQRLPLDQLMTWLSAFQVEETRNDTDMAPSSEIVDSEAAKAREPLTATYNIFAYNELGDAMLVAAMDTPEKALIQYKAALQFFSRVIITNADQAELSVGPIVQGHIDKNPPATKFS